ncbi:HNH endonuclease signature motif containing protein [Naasia sp. SYSU D00057]|uniref:HNH endonuclease signature motif containing protein n=1 Tax=Naasia sp. SYSU D00057 TaxID=2817380 RepID=UPI001B316542|nr:HNH endonuclease signature motif containing protein [Naasia sp. SYSU D00057]
MFEDVQVEGIPEDPLGICTVEDVLMQRLLDAVSPRPSLLDQLEEFASQARQHAARQYRLLDAMRLEQETLTGATWTDQDALEWRSLRAEVAAALEVHERTAQAQLELARKLVHDFPDTLDALERMVISERHARILVEQSSGLRDDLLHEYEERLLPYTHLVASRFERKAREIRLSLDAESLIARHKEALLERRVVFERAEDGMAWVSALLSAEDAVEVVAVIEAIAQTLKTEDEPRSLAQITADVFRDLMVDAAGAVPPAEDDQPLQPSPRARRRVTPDVFVHIPALTALGKSDAAGFLENYGPIDADTARMLAGMSEKWIRLLTDPETGIILKYGKVKYRSPEELRSKLRIRDGVCRFVGCTRPAVHCDLDHTRAWEEGGESNDCNLAFLCKAHHMLKHGSPWNVTQHGNGDGTLAWTSPRGRVYRTFADTVLPPPPTPRRPGAPPIVQREWLAAAAAAEAPPPF